MQLLPAFVAGINRIKEGHRIGHVEEHGDVEGARFGPERIEAAVIDGHQGAVLVAHMQAKRLPNLEASGAGCHLGGEAFGGPMAEFVAVFGPGRPVHAGKHPKAIGSGVNEVGQVALQNIFTPAAIKIDQQAHIGAIHHLEQVRDGLLVPAAAKIGAKVVVGVNHGESGLADGRLCGDELRAWPVIG